VDPAHAVALVPGEEGSWDGNGGAYFDDLMFY